MTAYKTFWVNSKACWTTTVPSRVTMRKSKMVVRNTNARLEARYARVNMIQRAKQLTTNQDRNPFVLVLVDGDGYLVS